ncbi:unconventional myosin-IXAb-like, partial [Saccoglossus kowalevskii]
LDSISFDDYNVFVIGQILKSYFRDLQHPLMSFELYDDFLRAAHLTNPQERIQSLYDVITKLPKANYDILERLMFHLARVVECIISEQLKKLKSTLADLQTLEIAETTANQRLSTIQSLSQNRHHTSSGSFTEEDMDITTDEEEEQILSQQLKILQEEKYDIILNLKKRD